MKWLLFVLLFPITCIAQPVELKLATLSTNASFRGLSVVDDSVIWMSGSEGTVCRSTDGGINYSCILIPGFDSSDFRSVYAFDANTAIVCNTGSPAKILRTGDGGNNWTEVYSNENVAAFIDGIDFWNDREGIVYGDPVDGRMMIVVTADGGLTWSAVAEENCPQLAEGETCFAASGSGIQCTGSSHAVVATGGIASRLFFSDNKGASWQYVSTPILQGKSSTGIFSLAFYDDKRGVIAGGDYKSDTLSQDNIFLTNDGGNNWQMPSKPTRGYRECVIYISDKQLLAAGPSGIDISENGGLTWTPFSDEKKFHTLRKARNGNLIVIAGGNGKTGIIKTVKE